MIWLVLVATIAISPIVSAAVIYINDKYLQ